MAGTMIGQPSKLASRAFRNFEQIALHRLIGPVLGPATVDKVLREASFLGAECSGSGYSIAVEHCFLPAEIIEFENPETLGRSDKLTVSFSAFIKERVLVLSCEVLGNAVMPAQFREQDVSVVID